MAPALEWLLREVRTKPFKNGLYRVHDIQDIPLPPTAKERQPIFPQPIAPHLKRDPKTGVWYTYKAKTGEWVRRRTLPLISPLPKRKKISPQKKIKVETHTPRLTSGPAVPNLSAGATIVAATTCNVKIKEEPVTPVIPCTPISNPGRVAIHAKGDRKVYVDSNGSPLLVEQPKFVLNPDRNDADVKRADDASKRVGIFKANGDKEIMPKGYKPFPSMSPIWGYEWDV